MEFNFNLHARRSIRLKGHDYSTPGDYFITICSLNRECLLGRIQSGEMILMLAGKIIAGEWLDTPKIRPEIELGPFVIMPNHLHGVISIHARRGDPSGRPVRATKSIRAFQRNAPTLFPGTIGAIIGQFKSISTKKIRALAMPGFYWQRNYYEHIIRDQVELKQIQNYIAENPINWPDDPDNPQNARITP